MKKLIAVGLSGGIDSSFAAFILKKKRWKVIGYTLKFFPEDNRCCDFESLYQAQRLCHKLDIPHFVLDVRELFKEKVIDYFINSYLNGLTPNPCAFCNHFIKFGYFLEKIKSLGIDYLATGHYARIEKRGNLLFLKTAKDKKKSQEYFLSLLPPAVLKHLVFPLGEYTKEKVKKIVQKEKIVFKERKESQDVCFVKGKSYRQFIEENSSIGPSHKGNIRHVEGQIIGTHQGIYNFTYGQREGIGISWQKPLYVTAIDRKTKTITVGERKYLYTDKFMAVNCNWFAAPQKYSHIKVKIRYNFPLYDCCLRQEEAETIVYLKEKVDAVTPGQIATFYYGDKVLGGGIISLM